MERKSKRGKKALNGEIQWTPEGLKGGGKPERGGQGKKAVRG